MAKPTLKNVSDVSETWGRVEIGTVYVGLEGYQSIDGVHGG